MLTGFIPKEYRTKSNTSFIVNEKVWLNRKGGIYIFSCDYRVNQYQKNIFDKLGVAFPSDLGKAVPKRQAEFLAGRYAAKEAMRNAKNDKAALKTVGVGKHRCPIWPNKFIGSITHNNSKAICAITYSGSKAQLGIDFEDNIPSSVALEIGNNIHSDNEKKILIEQGLSNSIATTIIFSAKESLFKALYPKIRKYFGFEQASLSIANVDAGYLILTVDDHLVNEYFVATQYICCFSLTDSGVFTLIHSDSSKKI